MEAVPRLPMINFDLKASDPVSFGASLKQYIASFYHEDPESYTAEIQNLESLRSAAVRPSIEVASCQILKKYYCQLHFLKARFPMEEGQPAAVYFPWRDAYSGLFCSVPDIKFELMCVLYNIGALHTQLGAEDSRVSPDGMKMSCTHFQCAAWAFQTIKETYQQLVSLVMAPEIVHFMHEVCLAQAQECILEKSMMDNRKATIIAKVAVQVEDYYKQALTILQGGGEDGSFNELLPRRIFKHWSKYLNFKVAYHRCLSLLYQGQQAEEQQKMGERVAFYQAACNQLEEARKLSKNLDNQSEIDEALSFTLDVVEGKRKAAKNENEFIYHEEVPEKEALLEVKGASLVKGIPFNVHDIEVSGPDIFGRLVPMEAHEASSVYSEQKADMLRRMAEIVEQKDQQLAEFMSSLQLEFLNQIHQGTGMPQDIVDRAAALAAKPDAIQELVNVMSKLSGASQDVESMLSEMDQLLQAEKQHEEEYQKKMGPRPPSIVATDLSREAAKYGDAHTKASDSNINLHKAMSTHITYLKILSMPLLEIQRHIPSFDPKSGIVDDNVRLEVENLVKKVDEMKAQRAQLYGQLRDAACQDDITGLLVTRQPEQPLEQLFQQELQKHQKQAAIIEQNLAAQDNILRALTDAYARFSESRKLIQDIFNKRSAMITSLMNSYSAYDDLIAKANKGVDFYNKLETNIAKLLQRVKSTCKVQEEEREQILVKNNKKSAVAAAPVVATVKSGGPKLRDYLDAKAATEKADLGLGYAQQSVPAAVLPSVPQTSTMQAYDNSQIVPSDHSWIPSGVRPTPVGSEKTSDIPGYSNFEKQYAGYSSYVPANYMQQYPTYPSQYHHSGGDEAYKGSSNVDQTLADRLQNLSTFGDVTKKYATPEVSPGYPSPTMKPPYSSQAPPTNQINPSSMSGNQYVNMSSNAAYASYGQMQAGEVKPQSYTDYSMQQVQPGPPPAYSSQSIADPKSQTYSDYPPMQSENVAYPQQQQQQQQQQQYYAAGQTQPANYPSTGQNYYTSYPNSTTTLAPSTYSQSYSSYPTASTAAAAAQNYPSTNTVSSAYPAQNYVGYTSATTTDSTSSIPASTTYSQNYSSTNLPQSAYIPPNYGYSSSATMTTPGVPTSSYGYAANQYDYGTAYQNQDGFQQYYNAFGNTNQSQMDPNMQYTSAGAYPSSTVDASESYNGVNYESATGNYYNAPYGYQGVSDPNAAAVAVQNAAMPTYSNSNVSSYDNANPYMNQGNRSMTYMQSNAGAGSTTIPSITNQVTSPAANGMDVQQQQQQTATQSAKNTNVDLLAGLDFSVSHPPMQPQQPVAAKPDAAKKEDGFGAKSVPQTPPKSSVTASKPDVKHEIAEAPENIPAERIKRKTSDALSKKDPFLDPEVLNNFVQEIEKFEKFVDGLTSKTLNGPTPLELKWKEVQNLQYGQDIGKKLSISVARCYPMKNRFPDILPYDDSRVELKSTRDDYINASHLRKVTPHCPPLIVTQEPLAATLGDFWTMIWEQQVEIIVCLLNDSEIASQVYWPVALKQNLIGGKIAVTLESINVRQHWTERAFTICSEDSKSPRCVAHLQLSSWPANFFPTSPASFLSLVNAVLQSYQQQRNTSAPIVVHCLAGVGRSGLFCMVASFLAELAAGQSSLPDLVATTALLSNYRKNILKDREYLRFGYQVVLYHAQEFLMNRGILTTRSTFEETRPRTHTRHPSQDLLRESLGISPSPEGSKFDTNSADHKGGLSSSVPTFDPNDPLSCLDPLWTIRKDTK